MFYQRMNKKQVRWTCVSLNTWKREKSLKQFNFTWNELKTQNDRQMAISSTHLYPNWTDVEQDRALKDAER